MKKSACLFALCFFCASSSLFSQKLIALQHAGSSSFYSTLPDAYNAAVNGDTIYLPGGNFDGINMQKSLTLIGVGHDPDSTSSTGQTILSSLAVSNGADNSFITSIYINNYLYSYGNPKYVTISRCYIRDGILFDSGTRTNWTLSENWLGELNQAFTFYSIYTISGVQSDFLISNNVFLNRVNTIINSEISNNIFINSYLTSSYSVIRNNIFHTNHEGLAANCQWYNNLNGGINGGPSGSNNTGSGNYLDNAPLTSVFVNFDPGNNFYQNDFHVTNPAYLGDDGAPVGIYGGPFPWKEGSLPGNPHIKAKTISSTTNPDGTLHINITVNAQDH